jgi:hypothetical protein
MLKLFKNHTFSVTEKCIFAHKTEYLHNYYLNILTFDKVGEEGFLPLRYKDSVSRTGRQEPRRNTLPRRRKDAKNNLDMNWMYFSALIAVSVKVHSDPILH